MRPNKPPQNAFPSGYVLLASGAEQSEALATGGGGAPPGFAGVGPRETNKKMPIQSLYSPPLPDRLRHAPAVRERYRIQSSSLSAMNSSSIRCG